MHETVRRPLGNSAYVGWFADDPSDTAHYVKRIEMDGVRDPVANASQVGYSDDLIYGAGAIPEPGTALVVAGHPVEIMQVHNRMVKVVRIHARKVAAGEARAA